MERQERLDCEACCFLSLLHRAQKMRTDLYLADYGNVQLQNKKGMCLQTVFALKCESDLGIHFDHLKELALQKKGSKE